MKRRERQKGQATVEYMTLLAVVVSLALIAGRALRPIVLKIQERGALIIKNSLDSPDLHHGPFKK